MRMCMEMKLGDGDEMAGRDDEEGSGEEEDYGGREKGGVDGIGAVGEGIRTLL
jgi:hypothetical protein